ncbi:MAG: hypothetical protein K2O49_05450 [Muribaculaceae bacterium]|nr:hypothetical protein [Muribaculaceae bacterium]
MEIAKYEKNVISKWQNMTFSESFIMGKDGEDNKKGTAFLKRRSFFATYPVQINRNRLLLMG